MVRKEEKLRPEITKCIQEFLFYNEFADVLEYSKAPPWKKDAVAGSQWSDNDLISLQAWLARKFGVECGVSYLSRLFALMQVYNARNPVTEWLNSLVWDQVHRVDDLLSEYADAQRSDYTTAASRTLMLSAVARALDPGCFVQDVICLNGKFGTSSFVKILGGDYYSGPYGSKIDCFLREAAPTSWFVELDVEEAFNRRLEHFCLLKHDKFRKSYTSTVREVPRQCVFVGTYVPPLSWKSKSSTLKQRIVRAGDIDLRALARDREQLFAEAVYRYKKGESYHFENADVITQAKREEEDPYMELLQKWLEKQPGECGFRLDYLAQQVLGLSPSAITKAVRNRLARALKLAGFKSVERRDKVLRIKYRSWIREDQQEDADDPPPTPLNLPCPI